MSQPSQHKCLRFVSGEDPSQDLPCQQCDLGPCAFTVLPNNRKPYTPQKRKKPAPKGKPFPRDRKSEAYMGIHNETAYLPMYNIDQRHPTTGTSYGGTGDVSVSGRMFESSRMVEINRLPNSNGMQVVHERLYMEPLAAEGIGDTFNWFVKSSPPSDPTGEPVWDELVTVASYTKTYLETALVNALSPSNTDYEELFPTYLRDKIRAIEPYAFNAMRPSFKTGFSTLNFLYELTDLTDLVPNTFKTLSKLTNTLSATLRVMGDLSKEFRARRLPDLNRSTLNQLVNFTAEVKLTKDFGIEPLIKDIDQVCKVVTRLQENLANWTAGSKALQLVRHFKANIETDSESRYPLSKLIEIPLWGGSIVYDCQVSSFDSQSNGTPTDHVSYNATMAYTYASKTLGDMCPEVAILYTGLGIKPDASIIWNAIPFSFVLDWFVDIQGFLDKYASLDLITSEVTIQSWLMGIRSRPVWTCTPAYMTWNPGKTGTYLMPTITLRGQSYSRLLVEPDVEQLVDINSQTPDGLTLNRGYLTAALAKKLVFH